MTLRVPSPSVPSMLSGMTVSTSSARGESIADESGHRPVLLYEAIAALRAKPGGSYIDATFGGGGHTRALIEASTPGGVVVAIDADPSAIERANALAVHPGYRDRLTAVQANFDALGLIAKSRDLAPINGVLFDLGLSSFQLDAAERGFAFRLDGPLDMRFDPSHGVPASELVNTLSGEALAEIIFRYGEDPRSRRIAAAIVREREQAPILSTAHLATIIQAAAGGRRGKATHPATRSFQALRIAVNDELGAIERALHAAVPLLANGGRLVVISFHSLEDRIVKRFITDQSATCTCPPELPVCMCDTIPVLRKIGGAVRPTAAEQQRNPRSRSAILRIAERLHNDASPGGRS